MIPWLMANSRAGRVGVQESYKMILEHLVSESKEMFKE